MSKMNRTKFNVWVNLQSLGRSIQSLHLCNLVCACVRECVLFLYAGIPSTPLFTGFVYSQITLFKVRSAKRVWRINAHFLPLRVQKFEGCDVWAIKGAEWCFCPRPWIWVCEGGMVWGGVGGWGFSWIHNLSDKKGGSRYFKSKE